MHALTDVPSRMSLALPAKIIHDVSNPLCGCIYFHLLLAVGGTAVVGKVFVVLLGRLLAALLHELGEVALLLEFLELVQ